MSASKNYSLTELLAIGREVLASNPDLSLPGAGGEALAACMSDAHDLYDWDGQSLAIAPRVRSVANALMAELRRQQEQAAKVYCDCCGRQIVTNTVFVNHYAVICFRCRGWKPYGDLTPRRAVPTTTARAVQEQEISNEAN